MTEITVKEYKDFEVNIIPAFDDNYIFLIRCFKTYKTICVDPGQAEPIDDFLQENGWNLDYIIITHKHFDHISGISELKKKYNCQVIANSEDKFLIPKIDTQISIVSRETIFKDNNFINVSREIKEINSNFKLGEIIFSPFSTAGHCSGHISYFIGSEKVLFCGDTLFSSGCGRLFSDGSHEELFESLNKIKNLPKNTEIYCSHEYTLANIEFALTLDPSNKNLLKKKEISKELRSQNQPTIPTNLENELKTNPFLRFDYFILRRKLGFDDEASDFEVFKETRNKKDVF